MSRLPRITGKEIIRALGTAGFEVARVKGSHYFLQHADGRVTVVPVHPEETIGPALW
jgi:predicted RNA binding protein YcfA (HicA-like mRNA interferase family)